jgi:hypothetical protein
MKRKEEKKALYEGTKPSRSWPVGVKWVEASSREGSKSSRYGSERTTRIIFE